MFGSGVRVAPLTRTPNFKKILRQAFMVTVGGPPFIARRRFRSDTHSAPSYSSLSEYNHSQATNLAIAAPSQAPVMGYPAILSAAAPGRTRTRDHEVCRAALGNNRCPPAAINGMQPTKARLR